MKRVNYHLTETQIKQLKAISKKTGLTVAELIRRAIDEFLKKDRRPNGIPSEI
jgi:predicted DNA-binding protein